MKKLRLFLLTISVCGSTVLATEPNQLSIKDILEESDVSKDDIVSRNSINTLDLQGIGLTSFDGLKSAIEKYKTFTNETPTSFNFSNNDFTTLPIELLELLPDNTKYLYFQNNKIKDISKVFLKKAREKGIRLINVERNPYTSTEKSQSIIFL